MVSRIHVIGVLQPANLIVHSVHKSFARGLLSICRSSEVVSSSAESPTFLRQLHFPLLVHSSSPGFPTILGELRSDSMDRSALTKRAAPLVIDATCGN